MFKKFSLDYGVRVYSFTHDGNRCYMADDPNGGDGIYCLPALPKK
jgi:hypothetical protein